MKILIVDDTDVLAQSLKITIEELIPEAEVFIHLEFDTAFKMIGDLAPDAVVLDILSGSTNGPDIDRPGDTIKKQIWDYHFCPLVIYSARPEIEQDAFATIHPLVRTCIKRGAEASDKEVAGHLKELGPIALKLRGVRNEAFAAIGASLRDVYAVVKSDTQEPTEQAELVARIARRRVAASMDANATVECPLRPWEQYVYPHIGHDLLTGDVLVDATADKPKSSDYRVVLSPMCDLVSGRPGCLEKVLVAKCQPVDTFLKSAQLSDAAEKALRKGLAGRFSADQVGGRFCLPELPGVLPMMAVDLKELDLIQCSAIGEGQPYKRVASVDSPFRERISWAYVQVADAQAYLTSTPRR